DVRGDRDFLPADVLLLGVHVKGRQAEDAGDDFAERVSQFFQFPPVRLLHISDLHYNAKLASEGREEQDALFDSLVGIIEADQTAAPVDAIALTGDFATKSPADDLIGIRDLIQRLVRATVGPSGLERCFVIPGNHDLQWNDFATRSVSATPWSSFLEFYHS